MTKIFYGNQYVGSFKADGRKYSKWQLFKMNFKTMTFRVSIIAFLIGSIYGSFQIGKVTTEPITVFADKEIIKEVEKPIQIPILERICKAESGGKQFKPNGDVVRGIQNKSDIGYCQINEIIWNDQARKLGYDIYTLEGNKAMATWIFLHYGSEPWYLSKNNWK